MVHIYCEARPENINQQIGHDSPPVPWGVLQEIEHHERGHSFSAPLTTLKVGTPSTLEDLTRAHNEVSISRLLNQREGRSALISTGILSSALLNCRDARRTALALTCGSQTEGYKTSGGLDAVNGPAVAAVKFLRANPGLRLGMLVCDVDGGAGTLDIFSRLPDLKARLLVRIAPPLPPNRTGTEYFFDWLVGAIRDLNKFKCDAVLYQAGLNMHRGYGVKGLLSTSQIVQREVMVFNTVEAGIAWHFGTIDKSKFSDDESPEHICFRSIEATVRSKGGLDCHHAERMAWRSRESNSSDQLLG